MAVFLPARIDSPETQVRGREIQGKYLSRQLSFFETLNVSASYYTIASLFQLSSAFLRFILTHK